MELVRIINICLNKTCSKVWVGKHMSDISPIRNRLKRDAFSPLLYKFALEYAIRRIHVNQDGLKLNGNISFWFMLMMLIYLEEASIL
jgi:hypothetical protein